ncbi:DUF362 domain-containing protein [Verrucomicrobiaceae bacterium N1E253]|uniref:DUF362 domain-containing protein n=1 Tax=Oceaniferula marina TaxID=2748318 RepID=A0A851GB57_9BACT|nr:DUF362 domain-containing protein [Oceaniferula marina]
MNRRRFIETTAATAAAISWHNPLFAAPEADGEGPWDLVAVRNAGPVEMFNAGIAALGGMQAFVKKGQSVVVKPNIAWDQPPEIPANTNPDLVGAIVKECLKAGASKVTVFDHTCHNWKRAYKTSGIAKAVEDAGGTMAPANLEDHYREVKLPKAKSLKKAQIHKEMLDCDVLINVPVLKHHGGAKLSLCMKNLMGVVWDRRFFHKNGLDQCIADMCFAPRVPDLNIVDAYRILRKNGPQGKAEEDGELAKYLMIGKDMVALDAASAKLYGKKPEELGFVKIADKMGAGHADLSKVKIKRITIDA